MEAYLKIARNRYHQQLLDSILTIDCNGVASNADKSNSMSIRVAKGIFDILKTHLNARVCSKSIAQTSGNRFEFINMEYVKDTFLKLNNICPGDWKIQKLGNKNSIGISDFEQYAHLQEINTFTKKSSVLAAALGNDYTVSPDMIISRNLISDEAINTPINFVDNDVCLKSDLREQNGGKPILHASISSKWTIRSDRSQNSRTEALNLIRNRKGHLPHIVVVTAEPMPSRIASIALGTGDIDCVYHSALYELVEVVNAIGSEDSIEMLKIMIDGKRLKDISDLPLDLAI